MDVKNILILFLSALLVFGNSAEAMSKIPSTQERAYYEPQNGVRTIRYFDENRNRPISVELWYPTDQEGAFDTSADPVWVHPKEIRDAVLSNHQKRYPLILMSHGNRGDRRDRSWIAEHLVKQGFIVASVDHYGNTWGSYDVLISLKFWERARDISFVLDELLKDSVLKERIDAKKIGFVGYSLGGMTGLALGGAIAKNVKETVAQQQLKEIPPEALEQVDLSEGHKSFADPRIKAMLLICPAIFIYEPNAIASIKIPVALVASVDDEVLAHDEHAYQIIKHKVPAKLKLLRNGTSHFAFLNQISESGRKIVPKPLLNQPLNPKAIHDEVGHFAVSFFKEQLK